MFSNTFEIVSAAADRDNVIIVAAEGSAGTGQCPRKISMSWTCPGHVPSKCPVQISHYILL